MWVVLTFLRGAFWRVHAFDDDIAKKESLERWPRVAAVVPARNEAEFIARTVESLAKQEYAGELRVAGVGHQSAGGTGSLAGGGGGTGGTQRGSFCCAGGAWGRGWDPRLVACEGGGWRE